MALLTKQNYKKHRHENVVDILEKAESHRDLIDVMGNNHDTCRNYSETLWNRYYHLTYQSVVRGMLPENCRDKTCLDLGTSFGHWFKFLQKAGFSRILGAEISSERAEIARQLTGYEEIMVCDAAEQIPLEDESVDVVVSNDVFVHILQLDDQIAALKEIERILKPQGVLIFNQAMAQANGKEKRCVLGGCSYITLHEWLSVVMKNTSLVIRDIKPTYYHFRQTHTPLFVGFLRMLVWGRIPFAPRMLIWADNWVSRCRPLEDSDSCYLKCGKA